MPVTQKDIALRVGISQPVVGRILNGGGMVGDETRQRVLREAQRMGYRFNASARSLRRGKTQSVAVWVPHIDTAFCSRILSELDRLTSKDGYTMQITARVADFSPSEPFYGAADGVLALDPDAGFQSALELNPGTPPAAFMHIYHIRKSERFDVVAVSKTDAAREALSGLAASGCRRIAFLAHLPIMRDPELASEERYASYMEAMALTGQEPIVIETKGMIPDRDAAEAAVDAYLASASAPLPDALFCVNDDAAIGALRSLRRAGLSVPGDVRLIGTDGISDAADIIPSLTTVELPVTQMCSIAWELLKKAIREPHRSPEFAVLNAKLLVRMS